MAGAGGQPPLPSVPTFQLSPDQQSSSQGTVASKPSSGSFLSVPTPIKSNIGINNPLNAKQFPLAGSQQLASSGSATGNPRNKVGLAPGFSLMDWVRLSKSGKDLTGVGGPMVGGKIREVTRRELKKHNKRKDAWMALNGAVYNVTHYMDFHPGGWDELVKGAGKDATDMFNEIHKWVNYQGLLEACLVGKLVDDKESLPSPPSKTATSLLPPPTPVLPPIPSKPPKPTMDYFQTDTKLTLNIYTKRKGLKKHNVIIDNEGDRSLKVTTLLPQNEIFIVHMKLNSDVKSTPILRIGETSGKIEVDLEKCQKGRWTNIGSPLDQHLWYGDRKDLAETYRDWSIAEMRDITHNTKYIVLSSPESCHMEVGPGQHVMFSAMVENTEMVRSYTPVTHLDKDDPEGSLVFLIKIYPDGVLTSWLSSLSVGDHVRVSNSAGSFSTGDIPAGGQVILLAAGTGITPFISIIKALSNNKLRPTVKLVTFDRTPKDIIWKDQIAKFQAENSSWLSVVNVVSTGEDNWQGETGRINEKLLRQLLSGCEVENMWFGVCGPPGFNREAAKLLRQHFNVDKNIYLFEG